MSDQILPHAIPAAWYEDRSGSQRWWDGQQWTEYVVEPPIFAAAAPAALVLTGTVSDAAEGPDEPEVIDQDARKLPKLLRRTQDTFQADKTRIYSIRGAWITKGTNSPRWLTVTTKRVIFLGSAGFQTSRIVVPLDKLGSIDLLGGALASHLEIIAPGQAVSIRVYQKAAETFLDHVHEATPTARGQTIVASPSAADELGKFAALHSQGILTDEEWSAKKAQLLN